MRGKESDGAKEPQTMSNVKYIKSARSNLVYAIERSEYKTKFRTPENYFKHAERVTWVSLVGFNTFVMYRGTWYSVDRTDHGYITILEFVEIDAEQAAEIETAKAYKAMTEASEHERKASDAAIEYDPETAKKEAQEARFSAAYAKACAKHASEYAAAAGTSGAAASADIASEYAAHADDDARSATETAKQCARELEERAEIIAQISDPQHREYIRATAEAHQWTPDETRANVAYYAANRTANAAARAFLAEYADVTGRSIEQDDDEYLAAHKVARDEITGVSARATGYDREIVAAMVEAIAQAVRDDIPTGPEGYHAELVRKADDAAVCRVARADVAHEYGVTAADRETMSAMIEELADATRRRPTYQRHELESYLGEPDDYDVSAIEHDATAYDPATGRTVWAVDSDELAEICERHQLQFYAPAF